MLNIKLHSKLIQGGNHLLDEGRREEEVLKAFPDKKDLIEYFTAPTRVIENNKYLMWMVKNATPENKGVVHATVHYYNIILKKGDPDKDKPELKDINTFKTLEDLEGFVEDYDKSIKELEREGVKVIYPNDGRWEVIRPFNVQASCHRGVNSQWCIAATKSQNYYKAYTKTGAIFYTIIDYSKKPKEKDSLFTYVFVRDLPDTHRGSKYVPAFTAGGTLGKIDIFDAQDEQLNRGDVYAKLPDGLETKFFNIMKEDSGLGELSSQLENYNHFFVRLKRLLKAEKGKQQDIGLFDSPPGALPETLEFIEEWHDEYSGKTKIYGDKKKALRNIYLLLDRIIALDEINFKKSLADSLESTYADKFPIPKLNEYIKQLKFNPNWYNDLQDILKQLTSEEYYDLGTAFSDIQENLKKLVEISTAYEYYDGLSDVFKLLLKFNKVIASRSFDYSEEDRKQQKKGLADQFIKDLMKKNNPKAKQFLDEYFDSIVGDDEYLIRDALAFLIMLPNIIKNEDARKKYRNYIAERALLSIEMSQNKKEVKNVATKILDISEIEPELFDKAMQLSDEPLTGMDNPLLRVASEESVTKVAEAALAKYKKEDLSLERLCRYCMFIIPVNNLPKNIARQFLDIIAVNNTSRMRAYLTNSIFAKIQLKLEDVLDIDFWKEIDKIRDELEKAGALSMLDLRKRADESKIFRFNKDYKVFKLL